MTLTYGGGRNALGRRVHAAETEEGNRIEKVTAVGAVREKKAEILDELEV